jgi:protein-L-isoaspartate(D-aspartate) O-methyltransferase
VTATTAADADEARRLRDAMTDKLVKLGAVASPQIEAAFRAVPRHAFARPGTLLEECYRGDIVRNKKDADGVTLSSISGAWLQARMIAQAGIGPGARVLEIGTTGYNAAVIAEVAAPGGHVVTLDIDPEVSAWADAALKATGYRGRPRPVRRDHRDSWRVGRPALVACPAFRRRDTRRAAADERRHPLHRLP